MPSSNPNSSPTAPRTLADAFAARRAHGQAALIPYICAGFPTADDSLAVMEAAAEAGADIVELGVPFSDPLADGPTIQRATFKALEAGMTVRGALDILRRFRSRYDTPVVLFTYLNPVHHFGLDRFVREAAEAGAQAILLTDLPAGADAGLEAMVREGGLELIRLLAPTTARTRIPAVMEGAGGFLYYISRTGVTGARTALREELAREVEALREEVALPIAVGFGISTPEQARLVAGVADGVVVGSALVDRLEEGGVEGAGAFLAELRAGMDGKGEGG